MIPATLRKGDRSTTVARWQTIVGAVADGVFGAKTELATKVWQAAHALTADGVVGPMTWAVALAGAEPAPPASSGVVQGLDVSYVQRNAIHYPTVKAAGFEFVWIKSSEGNTGRDSIFDEHVKAAQDAGLYVGAYHFARPSTDNQDAIRELENMYASTKGLGTQPGELRPVLDLESTKLPGAMTHEWAEVWIWLAYKYWGDVWPVVYTGSYFWDALGKEAQTEEWVRNCPLWVAEYPIDFVKNPERARTYIPPTTRRPRIPKPWKSVDMWQWSGNNGPRPPGCKVDVDRNYFFGTLDDFKRRMVIAGPDAA